MSYYVYILESIKDARYCIGQTEDLEKRLDRHNAGRNRSTKASSPWKLKWWKEFESRSESVKEEKKLKGIKKRQGVEGYMIKNNFRGVAQPG